MKKLISMLGLFVLILANVNAEIVTPGSVIDISAVQDTTSSLDIKDVIKTDLLRPYGANEFQIDINKLPSVNDYHYLLTQITEKPIVVTPDEFTINGKAIKFINGNAFVMPLTKYTLAKNLRVKPSGDSILIEDSKLSLKTDKLLIKDGVAYLGENNIPLRIMPNMILNDLIAVLGEDNLKKVMIQSNDEKVEYTYVFNRPAKLLFLFDISMDVEIIVDAQTGDYKIKKPFLALFTSGEDRGIKDYDFTQYAAF